MIENMCLKTITPNGAKWTKKSQRTSIPIAAK
jgi:hypothetical protein